MIREATLADATVCREIYAPYVTGTGITFETEVPALASMEDRIAAALAQHSWVVLQEAGGVRGFAYAGPFGDRAAYRWSCIVSVYLEPGRRRTGAGRLLYLTLFDRLVARGYVVAAAGITLPNEPSLALHRAVGFTEVGVHRGIGWKHGIWRDVSWLQRDLVTPRPAHPPEPW